MVENCDLLAGGTNIPCENAELEQMSKGHKLTKSID
jgi:hypothetical protein